MDKLTIIATLYKEAYTVNIKINESQVTNAHNLINIWIAVMEIKSQRLIIKTLQINYHDQRNTITENHV